MPSVQELFSDAEICSMAGEALRSLIVPQILKINEDFFVTSVDAAITAGVRDYRMPVRTAYGKLRDVVGVDAAGEEYELDRYEPSDLKIRVLPTVGSPSGYYIEHDQVRLVPTPTATNGHSIRMKYERRPGRLCLVGTDAFKVTTYNTGTGVAGGVTPSAWTTATIVDVIRPDGLFSYIDVDKALSAVSSGVSATLTVPIVSSIVGYYVAEQGYSPIPQIPEEGHPWIAQATAVHLLGFHGDAKNYATAKDILKDVAAEFLSTVRPRVADGPRRYTSRNNPFNAL